MKPFLALLERNVLVNSFVLSNFNYCTLVWMFASSKSLTKIETCTLVWMFASSKSLTKTENLFKRALRFMLDDYGSKSLRNLGSKIWNTFFYKKKFHKQMGLKNFKALRTC